MRRNRTAARLALAACSVLLLAAGVPAAGAGERVVRIVNRTGYAIVQFYGSNVGTRSWQEDILASRIIMPGSSVAIDFDDGTRYCAFDFKAVFSDGDVLIRENVDVCRITTFTYE